jgi:Flp pilus assembly protein TadD
MTQRFFSLGLIVFVLLAWSGCDSGQNGQEPKTEPKAESEPMATAETPPAGEVAKVEGALKAPEGVAGAAENAEGIDHFQQGHWDVAQEHFNKALAANADLAEAHYNLALALDKLGDHGEATNHFKKALDLGQEDPRIKDSGILKAHLGG